MKERRATDGTEKKFSLVDVVMTYVVFGTHPQNVVRAHEEFHQTVSPGAKVIPLFDFSVPENAETKESKKAA